MKNERMHATINFDRAIDPKNDRISFDGFTLIVDKPKRRYFKVDFLDVEMEVSKNDPTILCMSAKNPDLETFPNMAELEPIDIQRTNGIEFFRLDTETLDGSEPLQPLRLEYLSIVDADGHSFKAPRRITKGVFGLKEYDIPVVYEMYGRITVEARSPEEAVRYLQDHLNDFPLPDDASYVQDSMKVDTEGIAFDGYGNQIDIGCI